MTRTISRFAVCTWLLATSLAAMPAQGGVLESLLLASEIRSLRAKVDAGSPLDSQRLEDAIAEGGSAGLELARAVFAYDREALGEGRPPVQGWLLPGDASPGPVSHIVRNGLARRRDQLPAVLDLLEEEVRTPVYEDPYPEGQRIEDFRGVWGGVYIRMHGGVEPAFRKAAEELQQPGLDAVDRALRIEVFGMIGRNPERPRELAFDFYRPYLRAATGEEQAAAVSVAGRTWDSGAIDDLRALAYESPNPFVREGAFVLVGRFLRYGSAYPPPGKHTASRDWAEAHRKTFDPEGLRRWNQGHDEWYRELHILAYGEPPAPPMPPPPSIDLRGASVPPAEAAADPGTRSFAPMDRSEGPAAAPPLPASSTTERRPAPPAAASQERPMRPSP